MSKGQAILHTFLAPFVLIVFLLLFFSVVLLPYTVRHAQTIKVQQSSNQAMHDYVLLTLLKSPMTPTMTFGEYFTSRPTAPTNILTPILRQYLRGCFRGWKFTIFDGNEEYFLDDQLEVFTEDVRGAEYISCPRKITSEAFLPQAGMDRPLRITLITCAGENACG